MQALMMMHPHRLVFECLDPFSSINLGFVTYGFGMWVMSCGYFFA